MQQQASTAQTLDELYKHQDALEAELAKFCQLSADLRETVDERERRICELEATLLASQVDASMKSISGATICESREYTQP
jgi:hypothetical protein